MPFDLPHLPFPSGADPDAVLSPGRPVTLPLAPGETLDLHSTFRCGQIFRWRLHGDTWYGSFGTGSLAIRHAGGVVEARALGVGITAREVWRFLALDVSLAQVYARLTQDRWVGAAIERLPGLRIVRQDPWECLVCYICSQWNNIPKIELSTERIARNWGMLHHWPEGVEVAAFPAPERLAALSPDRLRECALGYRCGYLVETARRVAGGQADPAALRSAPYEEALDSLLKLPGIGRKVADCILLFALDKPQACPVDVWVRRVIHELYPNELTRYLPDAPARAEKGLAAREYEAIVRFVWDRWGALAGYAQQYLFHARRTGLLGS